MRRTLVFDIEIYRNYFLIVFMDVNTGEFFSWEIAEGEKLDIKGLRKFVSRHLIIGFNSRNFDLPVHFAALAGFTPRETKAVADDIIVGNMKPWDIEREHGFKIPRDLDHIDLYELPKGQLSLKLYNGRLHGKRMQDLPIEPDALLTPRQMDLIYDYCCNDLSATKLLYTTLLPQIELREKMSKEYDIDLRSKSDAQVAEAVIKSEVGDLLGRDVKRPEITPGTAYHYNIPDFIRFKDDALNDLLDIIEETKFRIGNNGAMILPKTLADREIKIGDGVYRLGIGGLHSSEKSTVHIAGEEYILVDRDVTSYYPAIIINQNLYPKQMGFAFQKVYRSIVARRVAAKKAGDKVTADTLKIVVNGSFGKFGSKWSALYAPQLLIQTTITGQLSLLMLIHRLERAGIEVVSANTDGIVIKCHRDDVEIMDRVVAKWEGDTKFETEATEYDALYSRDVNNYIAIKPDGSAKRKGAFAPASLDKNPQNDICAEAVVAFLAKKTPLHKTIRECRDIRKFVTVRTVAGGAVKDDRYLGKAVRWYYSTEVEGIITYSKPTAKGTYKKVGRTEGARPLMVLPDAFPDDVDYQWYVREARSILDDIGYQKALF